MVSRTTLWRRKKNKGVLSHRGRHTAEDRQDRLYFVGSVAAQLLKDGGATHFGLKAYPQRKNTQEESRKLASMQGKAFVRMARKISFQNAPDPVVRWLEPCEDVRRKIFDSPHNADCLALAAAFIGRVKAYRKRPESLRGKYHRDTHPKRESSRVIYWQSIEGMTKQTAHYWITRRKSDFQKALKWLASLLKKHGLKKIPQGGESTLIRDDLGDLFKGRAVRDDLADFLTGKTDKLPRASQPRILPSRRVSD